MRKYYCVTSTFDNRGLVTAAITNEITAETMPESTYTETARKDIYCDWFKTLKEAEEHVRQAKYA